MFSESETWEPLQNNFCLLRKLSVGCKAPHQEMRIEWSRHGIHIIQSIQKILKAKTESSHKMIKESN